MNIHTKLLSRHFSVMFRRLIGLFAMSIFFFSCDNLSLDEDTGAAESSNGKCVVTFGLAEQLDSRAATSSVIPSSVDTSTLSFILKAALPEGSTLPESALSADLKKGIKYPALSKLKKASFNLDCGEWIFYLEAYKNPEVYQAKQTNESETETNETENETSEPDVVYTYSGEYAPADLVLTGKKTVDIEAGTNSIIFDMEASESGTGSVKVTLNCYLGSETCSTIKEVTATLKKPDGTADGTLTQQTPTWNTTGKTNGEDYTAIVYENNSVPKGSYLLSFDITLQDKSLENSETVTPLTIKSNYTIGVTVEPGSLSEKIDYVTDLKQRYSITYMNVKDDGTTEPFKFWDKNAAPITYYNPNSTQAVTLPSRNVISYDKKSFTGWFEDYTPGTEGNVGTYGSQVTAFKPKDGGTSTKGAKIYYAKWGDLKLYVSAEKDSSLGGGNDDTGDGSISAPYKTLSQAISHINKNSNDKLEWTIHIDGKVQGMTIGNSAVGTVEIAGEQKVTIKTLTIVGYTPSTTNADYPDALIGAGDKEVLSVTIPKPVNIKNLTITGGHGAAGAGLNVGSQATVALEGVTITENNTKANENDSTERNGGGILNAGKLSLDSCTITKNTSSGDGGGVFNQGLLYVYGSTVIGGTNENGNSAKSGGAIYNSGSSKVYIGYSSYTSDTENTIAAFTGNISYNTATETAGGGVYNQGTFIMNGGTIGNNKAPAGAGVYNIVGSNVGVCSLTGVTVNNNNASTGNGGGIWNDGTLTIAGTFFSNIAANSGGAIWSSSPVNVSGATSFGSNQATAGNGGAVYAGNSFMSNARVTMTQNAADSGSGGAIYAVGAVTIPDGTINSNTAKYAGGALWCAGKLSLSGEVYVTQNTVSAENAKGGGIYIAGADSTLAGAIINGNEAAKGFGGGVYIASGASVIAINSTIGTSASVNKAVTGGGIYNEGTLTVNGGSIAYNTASASGAAAGAGIYSAGELTITGNASVINNNATYGWGGGVYNAGTFIVQAADSGSPSISSNKAVNGAGVYTNGTNATFTMSAGTIGGNIASTYGGGVYNAGTMFMHGSAVVGDASASSFANNTFRSNAVVNEYGASGDGGGIYSTGKLYLGYSDASTQADFDGGIYYNYATNGAGIYNGANGEVYIHSGSIKYNMATINGGGLYNGHTLMLSGGNFDCNVAGSGGAVYNNQTMTMTGSATIGSKQPAEDAKATSGSFSNIAEAYGGGIYNNTSGTLTLDSQLIGGVYYNYAGVDGGGIYNANSTAISINAGEVLQNGVVSFITSTKHAGIFGAKTVSEQATVQSQ